MCASLWLTIFNLSSWIWKQNKTRKIVVNSLFNNFITIYDIGGVEIRPPPPTTTIWVAVATRTESTRQSKVSGAAFEEPTITASRNFLSQSPSKDEKGSPSLFQRPLPYSSCFLVRPTAVTVSIPSCSTAVTIQNLAQKATRMSKNSIDVQLTGGVGIPLESVTQPLSVQRCFMAKKYHFKTNTCTTALYYLWGSS